MRATLREAARRAYSAITRGTIRQVNDKKRIQEVDVDMMAMERKTGVERFQQYGISVVPHGPDQQQQGAGGDAGSGGGSGGSNGGGGDGGGMSTHQGQAHAAEAVVVFVNGTRSHPIVIAVDDRRYRVQGQKNGELVLYDDQEQQVHITRDGIYSSVPHGKKIVHQVMKEKQQEQQQGSGQQVSQSSGPPGQPDKGSQRKKMGTEVQAGKETHAMFHMDKDLFKVHHPTAIEHHIIDDQGQSKYHVKMDKEGKFTLKGKNWDSTFSDVAWNQDQGGSGTTS